MIEPSTSPPLDCPHLRAGREAADRQAWDSARGHFAASLAGRESAEAHEGLAVAAGALGDAAASMTAHERAYTLYRERGDRRSAARMALALSWDYRTLADDAAVAAGWLERAADLLRELGQVPERGWWLLREAESRYLPARDLAAVQRLAAEARDIAREHGEVSLEMEALALEGGALLRQGQIADGLRRLDQAAAAAAAGEVDNHLSASNILCQVLSACETVRDYDRAEQWCKSLLDLAGRSHVRPIGNLCRSHYAVMLIVRGRWDEAEAALNPGSTAPPQVAHSALVRLGELRLHQGRLDEAEALLQRVSHHPEAQLAMALLALERGDARTAVEWLERHLRRRQSHPPLERARAMAVEVRARAALGEHEEAGLVAGELQRLADATGTPGMHATARHMAAELAMARGDHEAARRGYEDAIDGWAQAGMPFSHAAAHYGLARALHALGRGAAAREQARLARERFEELGAESAAAAAGEIETPAADGAPDDESAARPPISDRELEVLRLVSQGCSNKEVAARLFLSEHTVKRHLANILRRLDLPSRAAAVAFAARHDLL